MPLQQILPTGDAVEVIEVGPDQQQTKKRARAETSSSRADGSTRPRQAQHRAKTRSVERTTTSIPVARPPRSMRQPRARAGQEKQSSSGSRRAHAGPCCQSAWPATLQRLDPGAATTAAKPREPAEPTSKRYNATATMAAITAAAHLPIRRLSAYARAGLVPAGTARSRETPEGHKRAPPARPAHGIERHKMADGLCDKHGRRCSPHPNEERPEPVQVQAVAAQDRQRK